MRVYTVSLEDMEFFCYHGCREDEKINGNTFMVDFKGTFRSDAGQTDALEDTINYGDVYRVIKAQMQIRSNLLEHVACRIADTISAEFPAYEAIEVTVSKKNPPVDGPCSWSRVTTRLDRQNLTDQSDRPTRP